MAFDTLTVDLLTGLETCLNTALQARPNPPAEVCVIYGEAFQLALSAGLLEDRCCTGFAGVRLAGLTPQVPAAGDITACGTVVWRADFEMGVARCAPFGNQNAGPSCAQMRTVAEQIQSDMAAMIEALCCFAPLVPSGRSQATAWLPFGPEGGCTGGIMGVSVELDACGCPQIGA